MGREQSGEYNETVVEAIRGGDGGREVSQCLFVKGPLPSIGAKAVRDLLGIEAQQVQHLRRGGEHRPQLGERRDRTQGTHQQRLGQQAHGMERRWR